MSREFDFAALGSTGGWLRLRHKRVNIKEGDPCPNCETTLQGAFCHICGQFAEDMHRSFFRLCFEFIEGFFHVDGRVWQTLPRLIFAPGRLTADYLRGKRAPQIPPFRLFIVTLFIVFAVGNCVRTKSEAAGEDPLGFLSDIKVEVSDPDKKLPETGLADAVKEKLSKNEKAKEFLALSEKEIDQALSEIKADIPISEKIGAASSWLNARASAIKEDPKRFLLILEIWAHRVAFLALPLIAFLICVLFIFQRRFYIYDHLVFSTHLLTFHVLLLTFILSMTLVMGSYAWQLAFVSPIHVWFHMRKVYSSGVFGTLFRMFLLGIGTLIGFTGLALFWLTIGANAMIT